MGTAANQEFKTYPIPVRITLPEEDGTFDKKKKAAEGDILSCVVRFRVLDSKAGDGYSSLEAPIT